MQEGSEEPQITRQQMWDERHAARDPIEAREPEPNLMAEAAALAPGRALDLGTGDGRNAIWLAGHGWTVTAVDFSRVALDRARAAADRAGVSVDWLLEDLVAWTPPAASFDLVCLVYIQLPAEERAVVLDRAAAAVAPGGSLFVVAHHPDNLAHGAPGPKDSAVLYAATDLTGYLDGFDVLRTETIERPVGEGITAVDLVLRAERRAG